MKSNDQSLTVSLWYTLGMKGKGRREALGLRCQKECKKKPDLSRYHLRVLAIIFEAKFIVGNIFLLGISINKLCCKVQ